MTESVRPSSMRSFLVLARASNLPTVWSNCVAGWLLSGGGDWKLLAVICIGASLLYTGGMFLNDAFDANFDREHRKERPIPSGSIEERKVWKWGFLLLLLGSACVIWIGKTVAIVTLLLVGCILFYNAVHKRTVFAPLIMAACRLLLYLVAASAGRGIDGFILWCALALAAYVSGLSYIARAESGTNVLRYWPCVLLVLPVALGLLVNDGSHRLTAVLFSTILVVRIAWSLRHMFFTAEKNIGKVVGGLIAAIVWVDLLAVNEPRLEVVFVFVGFFLLARFFQRSIPAT